MRSEMPTYSRLQKPVLVLNASYEPINICAARRALILVLKGIATDERVNHDGLGLAFASDDHTLRVGPLRHQRKIS